MKITASHILVETEEQAKTLHKEVLNGSKFDELATKHSKCPSASRGGNLGEFGYDQMVKPFETAAFGLAVDGVSDPVQTQFGWHLIHRTA